MTEDGEGSTKSAGGNRDPRRVPRGLLAGIALGASIWALLIAYFIT